MRDPSDPTKVMSINELLAYKRPKAEAERRKQRHQQTTNGEVSGPFKEQNVATPTVASPVTQDIDAMDTTADRSPSQEQTSCFAPAASMDQQATEANAATHDQAAPNGTSDAAIDVDSDDSDDIPLIGQRRRASRPVTATPPGESGESDDHLDTTPAADPKPSASNAATPFRIPKAGQTAQSPTVFGDERRRPSTAQTTQTQRIPKSLQSQTSASVPPTANTSTAAPLYGAAAGNTSVASTFLLHESLSMPYPPGALNNSDRRSLDKKRGVLTTLQRLKEEIKNAETTRDNEASFEMAKDAIRGHLHVFEHLQGIDRILMKASHILSEQSGLPRLYLSRQDGFRFDFDIRADAQALCYKWARGDFDTDIMRGIKTGRKAVNEGKVTGGGNNSNSLDPAFGFRVSGREFGTKNLVSGQWWPLMICALRDGAHGEMQAGISGEKGKGATSIILSGGHYKDEDHGDQIRYCGTEGSAEKPSDDTQLLFSNISTGNPVRVLRSSNLGRKSHYTPGFGFRFDGLYDVISSEVLDQRKSYYRFLLQRQQNQDPIRHGASKGAKPTKEDIVAYQNHAKLSG